MDYAAAPREPSIPGFKTTPVLGVLLVLLTGGLLLLVFADGARCLADPFFRYNEEYQGFEFMAAAMLLDGKPLYPDWNHSPANYVYGPLLPVLFAGAMRVFGLSLMAPKAVAFVFFLLALLGVVWSAWDLTRSRMGVLIAVGVLAALYRTSLCWYFSIRPDLFSATLALWAVFFARRSTRRPGDMACAFAATTLLALATLGKQNYALLCPACFGFFVVDKGLRKAALAFVPCCILAAGTLVWFNTGEENLVRATFMMTRESINWLRLPWVFRPLTTMIFLALSAFLFPRAANRPDGLPAVWVVFTLAALVLGHLSYIKDGGGVNAYLLLFFLASVLTASGVVGISREFPNHGKKAAQVALLAVAVFFSSEFLSLALGRGVLIPAPSPAPMFAFLRENKGKRIYYPKRNYLTYLADGQFYQYDPVLLEGRTFPAPLMKQLETRYFDMILGDFIDPRMRAVRDRYYRLAYSATTEDGFPMEIYSPRPGTKAP
jgi:hypothetical protein